jgi:hypothetical protein
MESVVEVSVDALSENLSNAFDIFICTTSFEDRCLTIPNAVKEISFEKIAICHFSNNYEAANRNLGLLRKAFSNSDVIEFEKDNPLINLDRIVKHILRYRPPKQKLVRLVIDITTFTHEMLMILVYLFQTYLTKPKFHITYLYCTATDYSTNETFENKWLSKGVGQIRSVLGYGGEMLPGKKTALIIFVGFEDERVRSIIELFEPSKVMIGHASLRGAINAELQRKNKSIFDRLMKTLKIDAATFEFSCTTPSDTKKVLDDLIEKHNNQYNIVVASLNNKLSTIGCALSVMHRPEVQICYPTALSYNISGYSKPGDKVYIMNL